MKYIEYRYGRLYIEANGNHRSDNLELTLHQEMSLLKDLVVSINKRRQERMENLLYIKSSADGTTFDDLRVEHFPGEPATDAETRAGTDCDTEIEPLSPRVKDARLLGEWGVVPRILNLEFAMKAFIRDDFRPALPAGQRMKEALRWGEDQTKFYLMGEEKRQNSQRTEGS